jgi:hypothetical protein
LVKPNYAFAKRQRDVAKKQKKEEKRKRKLGSDEAAPAEGAPPPSGVKNKPLRGCSADGCNDRRRRPTGGTAHIAVPVAAAQVRIPPGALCRAVRHGTLLVKYYAPRKGPATPHTRDELCVAPAACSSTERQASVRARRPLCRSEPGTLRGVHRRFRRMGDVLTVRKRRVGWRLRSRRVSATPRRRSPAPGHLLRSCHRLVEVTLRAPVSVHQTEPEIAMTRKYQLSIRKISSRWSGSPATWKSNAR